MAHTIRHMITKSGRGQQSPLIEDKYPDYPLGDGEWDRIYHFETVDLERVILDSLIAPDFLIPLDIQVGSVVAFVQIGTNGVTSLEPDQVVASVVGLGIEMLRNGAISEQDELIVPTTFSLEWSPGSIAVYGVDRLGFFIDSEAGISVNSPDL